MRGIKETISPNYFRSSGIFTNGTAEMGHGRSIFYGWVAGSNTCTQEGLRDIAETHLGRVKIIGGAGFIRFGGNRPAK